MKIAGRFARGIISNGFDIMNSKQAALILIGAFLTIGSILLTPRIDSIQLNNPLDYPFFYARNLPIIYYVATVYLILIAIFGKDRNIKLLSVIFIALLVEFTPSIMLVNPLGPDQYPYLAEATWLVKKGYIAPVHYLDQVPGLGLMFSQLMLITGLGPFEVSNLYPCIVVLATIIPLFLISEKLCGNGALAPLLFLSTNFFQINIFHRATYFFMLFSILMLLLVMKVARCARERSIGVLCVLVFSAACVTYPGSVIIVTALCVLLTLTAFLARVAGRRVAGRIVKHRLEIMSLIFLAIFFAWYMYVAESEFVHWIVSSIYKAVKELATPSVPSITQKRPEAFGLTPIFDTIIRARLGIIFLVFCLASLSALRTIWIKRNFQIFIPMLFLGFIAPTILFISTFSSQWVILKFAWYLMFTAAACICTGITHGRFRQIMRFMVFGIIFIGLFTLPILRYASIPYLHITTTELRAVEFIHTRYNGMEPIYCIEYPPYTLPRLQMDKDLSWDIVWSWPIQIEIKYNYLTSQRLLTRDGYYVPYMGSYRDYLESRITTLEAKHNLVYTSGTHTKLLIHVTNDAESDI